MTNKGIVYYTDNRLDDKINRVVQKQILAANIPIISVSLKPIDFGINIVLDLAPCYTTMVRQITTALEASTSKYVFFCEHDVLYPLSHFDFTPPKDNIFYYDGNVLRWDYPHDRLITYERLISLSGLSVNREFALNHYQKRLKKIEEHNLEAQTGREPLWARLWGYEPGTKKIKRGGFSDDDFETFASDIPMIDIRHRGTFSPTKVTLDSFRHKPKNWREYTIKEISGWDLNTLFTL